MLQPCLVGYKPLNFHLRVQCTRSNWPGIEFDMRLDEVPAVITQRILVQQGQKLLRNNMVRRHPFDNGLDCDRIDRSSKHVVIVDIPWNQRLHHVEISHLTIHFILKPLNTNDSITKYSQNQIFTFIILYAKKLQGRSRDINILNIHLSGHYQSVAHKLTLNDIAFNRYRSNHLQLVVDQHHFFQANHTTNFPSGCPDDVNNDIIVIKPQT